MEKILTVVGARPQFIKAATVSRVVSKRTDIREVLVHTGQHFDSNMSDVFFSELSIPRPQYHLGIHSGMHGAMTGQMLQGIEEILVKERPDWVLVYGDTNSTLAGALAAVKLHIPVAHVEAGLRSFNRRMPEEINRVLTDHASNLLFAPTDHAVQNLQNEGIAVEKIRRVGDVMFDAARFYAGQSESASCGLFKQYQLKPRNYVLATLHRAENTDSEERLRVLVACLNYVAQYYPVILPLHPRTRQAIAKMRPSVDFAENLHIIDPVGYLEMVALEKDAKVIATDSGGVQKEAYFHHVPCITLRDETEWVELVECGWNTLAGADYGRFVQIFNRAMSEPAPVWSEGLYGDGHAAEQIVAELCR